MTETIAEQTERQPLLDDLDKKLVTILQDDARASASEISRKTGYNENTIRYRIDRLKKTGVVKEFTALLNPRMIGLPIAAIMMITTEPNQLKEVFEELAALEETKHILQATGKHDLIVVAHYTDMKAMNDASQRIKSMAGVKEAEIHLATGLIKVETKFDVNKIA
ncbi:MAG: Lrp/AsnC family transcriptional regulator [Nitrososphaerota archaeon]|nr:Lrp/AsnC family transcriptional regulator [Nitrososphaerota archaeon]MDG6922089.1 Lrp/AsnC family transcriptional regulator [Nitrososphaerota archaeon]